jgi:hypothetical protein
MCIRCLAEGQEKSVSVKRQYSKLRPKWCPIVEELWWNENVVVDAVDIENHTIRYCRVLSKRRKGTIVVLPDWGQSFLDMPSFLKDIWKLKYDIWSFDPRSQGDPCDITLHLS